MDDSRSSVKEKKRPSSSRVRAVFNTAARVMGTRYTSAGCPSRVTTLADTAARRPIKYAWMDVAKKARPPRDDGMEMASS